MKSYYKKGVLAVAIVSFILGIPKISIAANKKDSDTNYDIRYRKEAVQERKSWKIKFNKELDSNTIKDDNIIIEDEDGKRVYADVSLDKDDKEKKTIIVEPTSRYKQDKEYYIVVKDNIKSKKGKKMRKPVKMYFNIKNAYAGLPCENGLIIVRDMAYSIDYLAQNSRLKNEIINDNYDVYYCYSPTEQKIKNIFGNIELNKNDVKKHYDKITYVGSNGEKSIYEWDNKELEYELVEPAVDAEVTVNSSAKVIMVKVRDVEGIDDAVYYKLKHSNEAKKIGETFVFTSPDFTEDISILNYNKNVIAVGKLNTHFSNDKKTKVKVINDNNGGNTSGNINNNGYATENVEGYLIYNNTGDKNNLYKMDTNGMFNNAIAYDNAQYINLVDDWIYYSNYSDKGKLYKIKIDGTGRQKICDDMAAYVNISGDIIYYSNHSDGGRLYKIRTNGSGRSKVSSSLDHEVAYINVSGDWIYYTDINDRHRPYVINTDGTYIAKLSDEWANSIQVVGDWIYYTSSTGVLSKVKKDGSGHVIPIMGQTREFDKGFHLNVVNNWIYYSNYLDGGKLYKIRTDGSGDKLKLTNETVDYINIAGNHIYYTSKGKLYKLPIDSDGKIKGEAITKSSSDNGIKQMEDLKVTVPHYDVNMKLVDIENKYLPKKVPGIKDDNTMHQFSVDWDRDKVNVRNGIRTYTGDIIGFNKKVKLELIIPSEMLNESNTITIYNNADKNSGVVVVENLYDNNLISNPPKLNVGDIVNIYDNEDCTKLLSKATVTRDGKDNKATIQRVELDKYGQKSLWITVIRQGKAESKPTEVKQGDIPTIVKAEDYDNENNYSFYSRGLGLGVDGRDFSIREWVPSQVRGNSKYSIYLLPSNGKLDISKNDATPIDTLRKGTSTWQGDKDLKVDSKSGILKKGKYSIFLVGEFTGEASKDNRGKHPYVKGFVSSDPKVIDVTEEVLPKEPSLRVKGSVQGGADIELSKAPAAGEHVWLIPVNTSQELLTKVENWSSEGNIEWPMNELRQVATCLEGDGSTKMIKAPNGINKNDPNYHDVEYKLIAVNKVGVSGFSRENVIVDNKEPDMFDEFGKNLVINDKKPEESFKLKVIDKGSHPNTLNENISIYIVPRGVDDYSKDLLDTAVKQRTGKVFNVSKGVPYSCVIRGLEAITQEEYARHYAGAGPNGTNLTNYKVLAVDKAGNISKPVYFNIIVNVEKLNLLINKAETNLFVLNDEQDRTLKPILENAKKILADATNKTQMEIDSAADRLESTMEKVGIVGLTVDHNKIAKVESNGLYLNLASDGSYLRNGSTIDSNLKLITEGKVDRNVKIHWTSSEPTIIDVNNGVVTRPIGNKTVKLTATLSYNNEAGTSQTKEFTVTVKGIDIITTIKKADYDSTTNKMLVEFSRGNEERNFIDKYIVMISKTPITNVDINKGVTVGTATQGDPLTAPPIDKDLTGIPLSSGTYYVYVVSVAKNNRGTVLSSYRTVVVPQPAP